MKNKYIKEMNSIHASESFKEEMIEKMNQQINPIHFFSLTTTKVAIAFACVCLSIVTALSIKNYYDVQQLKEQLFATKKSVEKILYQTDDFNRLMDRNYEVIDENVKEPYYQNPFDLMGMGSNGEIFPGETAKNDNELVKEEDISLEELKQLKKIPILKSKESVINHKDKIELMYQLIELYGEKGYQTKVDKDLLQFVTDEFYVSIYDTSIELMIDKDKYIFTNEKEVKDTVNQIIEDFKILFPKEYEIQIKQYEEDENYYVDLYEEGESDFEQMLNRDYLNQSFCLINNKRQSIRLTNKKVNMDHEYPLISYEEALNKLRNNESYATGGVKEYLNYNRVANVKLQYFFDHISEYFLPYYEFFIEVDYEKCEKANYLVNDGLKHYGKVYVPAISDEDIKANYGDAVMDLAQ